MTRLIRCDPCIKMLKEPYICLILLTVRGSRYRFLELKVVTVIPEVDRKIFKNGSYSLLPLTIGKRQDNNIFFQLRKMRLDPFDKSARSIIN